MGQNLTKYAGLFVYAFNKVPTEGQDPPTLWKNQVDSKTVNAPNTAGLSGTIDFKRSDIKGLLISGRNIKGKVKVFIIT